MTYSAPAPALKYILVMDTKVEPGADPVVRPTPLI